ncbi:hypothetical protein [Melghirimyces algeriensis]|uniref:Uncharacterized protein n=1 Tax=Melghirimyces algeriensis TaxID=910412 RepID=A0A521AEN4_9BACL|nr:hypothetical protein [Melghirimyces algeriensis]SMO33252.1 hypothetical protein SAMN06264849_10195 [Melghirimyces algeriensis]
MIINRKRLARAKVEKLKQGFSAYAETKEVAELIEKELDHLDLPVFVDRTPIGNWFIPVQPECSNSSNPVKPPCP